MKNPRFKIIFDNADRRSCSGKTPEHTKFLDAYQAKFKDYPRLGSVVGYSAIKSIAAGIRKAQSTETEKPGSQWG